MPDKSQPRKIVIDIPCKATTCRQCRFTNAIRVNKLSWACCGIFGKRLVACLDDEGAKDWKRCKECLKAERRAKK